jgi:D-amino-acid dehydrogenase
MVGSWFRRRVQQRAAGGRGIWAPWPVRALGPITGQLVAPAVLTGEAPPEPTPFDPLR